MRQPTQSEIDEAKAYLMQRIDAETSMRRAVSALLDSAALKILQISYKYSIPPSQFSFSTNSKLQREVDKVMEDLMWAIEECVETLAIANHSNEDDILAFIYREQYGKDFKQRLSEYLERYRKELQAFMAAAFFLSLSKSAAKKMLGESTDCLYYSDIVEKAVASGSDLMDRLNVRKSYGKGRRKSAAGAIEDLTEHAVAEGWMKSYEDAAKENGAVGFWCYRGSSYPCAQCDDECSYLHTFADPLPPFHGHCKCFAVPMFPF